MKYFSIDLETTGLDPEVCDIVEIAVVYDDLNDIKPLDSLPRFHCYVNKSNYYGHPFALSMHSKIFRRIATLEPPYLYLPDHAVSDQVVLFMSKCLEVDPEEIVSRKLKPNASGKNFGTFDSRFLEKIDVNFFHHRVLDPGTLYFDPKLHKVLPSTEECLKIANLSRELKHDAMDDALMVVELIRNYYKL